MKIPSDCVAISCEHISTLSKMSFNEIYVKFCKMLLPFILLFGDFRHSFFFSSFSLYLLSSLYSRNEKNQALHFKIIFEQIARQLKQSSISYRIWMCCCCCSDDLQSKKANKLGRKFSFAVNIYSVKLHSNANKKSQWHKARTLHWTQNRIRQDL